MLAASRGFTARELNQHSSRLLDEVARGEEVTVTRNGQAVARIVPVRGYVPAYPATPIGDIELPDLDFDDDDLSVEDMNDTLRGMGGA